MTFLSLKYNITADSLILTQFSSKMIMLRGELIEVSVIIIQTIHNIEEPISL